MYCCEWNHISKTIFASCGNDAAVRITDFNKVEAGILLKGHMGPINQVAWHPTQYFYHLEEDCVIQQNHSPHIIASCSGDKTIQIWDLRKSTPVKIIVGSSQDVLSIDFNKYENVIGSGGGDGTIHLWDLRSDKDIPLRSLKGHSYAIKKVKSSPFNKNIMASCGLYVSYIIKT